MRFLASFQGRRGEIVIMEDLDTGARSYYEAGVFQSHATADGTSSFSYVHIMARLLRRCSDVLLLGCAAGSLATMLSRQGKRVTLVDDNAVSFDIARQFFSLPDNVTCVVEDFHAFLGHGPTCFDGIGIDIGAASIRFDEEFDPHTCREIRTRLAPGGRIAMNMVAEHDIDPVPDRILAMLADDDLRGWIYDRPGERNRNAVLSVVPEKRPCTGVLHDTGAIHVEKIEWKMRCQRLHIADLPDARRFAARQIKQQHN
jgi:SAM-dependent methyltransferase